MQGPALGKNNPMHQYSLGPNLLESSSVEKSWWSQFSGGHSGQQAVPEPAGLLWPRSTVVSLGTLGRAWPAGRGK